MPRRPTRNNPVSWQTALSVEGLLEFYSQQDWEQLSFRLLQSLSAFESLRLTSLTSEQQHQVNLFVHHFLFLFSQADYVIPVDYRPQFVRANLLIANLVAISSAETTDAWLPLIRGQDNLAKLMTLYSARNVSRIPAQQFFDVNAQAASIWFWHFLRSFPSALADANAYRHLRYQLAQPDPRLLVDGTCCEGFFGSTYINSDTDKSLKQTLHQALRGQLEASGAVIQNRPRPRRIGVVTATWHEGHSVYRNHYDMVAALRPDYELVLIQTGPPSTPLADTSFFEEVIPARLQASGMPGEKLLENEFSMLYFPDVGMTPESLILANCRLAPIQFTSYGHSVSTFGSQIDYYLASDTVEDHERLAENYSERVLLLPGLGVTNVRPDCLVLEPERRSDKTVISCSWHSQKVNPPLIKALNQVLAACPPATVLFRIFPGSGLMSNGHFLAFALSLREALGPENVEICPPLAYQQYMEEMNQGHFALEPFPFGGCNTIVDSLHLRQPIVTLEGRRWYSRIGSAILRQADLPELVTTSPEDYVQRIVSLIREPEQLLAIRRKVEALDLDQLLFQKSYALEFKKAVDFLADHHTRLANDKSKEPIRLQDNALTGP